MKTVCPQSGKSADFDQHDRFIHTPNSQKHFRCESCNRAVPVHDNGTLYRHFAVRSES